MREIKNKRPWDDFEEEIWERIRTRRPFDLFFEFWKRIEGNLGGRVR